MQLTDTTDALSLTRQMIDIPSESGNEGPLADAVEAALRDAGFGTVDALEILRDGDAVCARTHLGLADRVVLAGHLDTVPIADNVPGRTEVRDGAARSTCSPAARPRSRSRARPGLRSREARSRC